MGQMDHGKKRVGGKHFNWEDRIRLEMLDRTLYPGKRRPNLSEIARRLGRHRSSVSREYRRGTAMNRNSRLEAFPVYSARKWQAAAREVVIAPPDRDWILPAGLGRLTCATCQRRRADGRLEVELRRDVALESAVIPPEQHPALLEINRRLTHPEMRTLVVRLGSE